MLELAGGFGHGQLRCLSVARLDSVQKSRSTLPGQRSDNLTAISYLNETTPGVEVAEGLFVEWVLSSHGRGASKIDSEVFLWPFRHETASILAPMTCCIVR